MYLGLAAIYIFNVFVLRGLPVLFRREMAEGKEPVYKSLQGGFSYARKHRVIMGGLLVVAVNNFSGYTFESMGPVFATDVFGAGPTLFGLLMSAQGLGSLATALLMVAYGRRIKRPGLFVLVAAMVQHLGSVLFSFAGNAASGFAVLLWLGTVSMTFGLMHTTLILATTPDRVRGRIVGLQILAMGMFPFGSLAVGELADAIGLQEAVRVFALSGFGMLVLLAILFPELRRSVEKEGGERKAEVKAAAEERPVAAG
jgi:ENTS family enterobactin (siderophore) exporter